MHAGEGSGLVHETIDRSLCVNSPSMSFSIIAGPCLGALTAARFEHLGKSRSIRYALEHWTGNLHSKFDPIPTNTERVLLIRAVSELESMEYSLECIKMAQQRHNDAIVAWWW